MNPSITTFIFDCFGVISNPVLTGWYKENRLNHSFVDENLPAIFRRFDLGALSEDDIVEYFSKYKGVHSTKETIREEIDSNLKLNEGLVDIIKELRAKGFKTVLLSNANNAFFERKIYPTYPYFKSLFNEIVISSSVGMVKPEPEIYLYTLEKVSSKPEESLFIDDSKINVDAAIKVGMKGFLYSDNNSFVEYIKKLGVNLE
jgi:epoxide hydrolase-like predicted phosphatase